MGKKEVKGGLVIDQMKKYAKRFADHSGGSAHVYIGVWFHPETDPEKSDQYSVEFSVWSSVQNKIYKPIGKHTDFRMLGDLINQIIKDEKENG